MSEKGVVRLARAIDEASAGYYRLVLLVGAPGSGKTRTLQIAAGDLDQGVVNVNLLLTERLLELTKKQRALRVKRILLEELDKIEGEAIVLDNIEVLFDPDLAQDPLRLLQGISRSRTVVSAWPGSFDGTHLTYAEPGHPEWRRYRQPEASIVVIDEAESRSNELGSESRRTGAQEKS